MKGWTRIMPSTITKYEIQEVAKDVIAFLKSKDYEGDEIYFILRKAIELYDEEDE